MVYPKILLIVVMILLVGCTSQNSKNTEDEWELSGTFEVGGMTLIGKEGRLGFHPQGDSEISSGGHFIIYFWGNDEELASTYRLIGVHKETGAIETLYPDWAVSKSANVAGSDAQSGAKYILNKSGKWRLETYMGDRYFDSIVVEAF